MKKLVKLLESKFGIKSCVYAKIIISTTGTITNIANDTNDNNTNG